MKQAKSYLFLLLFPLFALILFILDRLMIQSLILFNLTMGLAITTIGPTAIALYRKKGGNKNDYIKYSLLSLILVILFSLIELL